MICFSILNNYLDMLRLFISLLFIFAVAFQAQSKQVIVAGGDTLYSIAKDNGLNLSELANFNNIPKPYTIYKGQIIKFPEYEDDFAGLSSIHTVKPRDTLFSISRKYKIAVNDLANFNQIYKPYQIFVGQKIKIPSQNNSPQNYIPSDSSGDEIEIYDSGIAEDDCVDDDMHASRDKIVPILRSTAKIYNGQGAILPNEVSNEDIYAENNFERIRPALKSNDSQNGRYNTSRYGFIWPLKGKVISNFGPRKGGVYNDGINIKASSGAPVIAANEGVVIYSKNKLKGYGNLILLKHNNGYITSYAHNKQLLVNEGDEVKRGQKIATVGESGSVKTPQLHFTIRKGRLAVNPQSYLPNS